MKYILAGILFFSLMAGLFAYNASSASYIVGSFHEGLTGGQGNSSSYNASDTTLAHQQSGTKNATTTHYGTNYGWFNVSLYFPPVLLTIVADLSFINATAGHAFSATATVSDPLGGNSITSVSITSTIGTCMQYLNSSSGVNFSAFFVCMSGVPATTNVFITFADSALGASVSTSTLSNTYPDHNATLGSPVISPTPAYNDSNLTCVAGAWSDPDGDADDVRTWGWEKNGIVIAGENTQYLGMGNFTIGDSIICMENASNSVWATSNGSAVSAPVIIGIRPAGIYLEIIGFLALICLAMFFIAELSPSNISLGMIGGILLVIIGVWALNELRLQMPIIVFWS